MKFHYLLIAIVLNVIYWNYLISFYCNTVIKLIKFPQRTIDLKFMTKKYISTFSFYAKIKCQRKNLHSDKNDQRLLIISFFRNQLLVDEFLWY